MPISIKVKKVWAMLNIVLGGKLISKLESLKTLSAIFELKKTSTNEVPRGLKV